MTTEEKKNTFESYLSEKLKMSTNILLLSNTAIPKMHQRLLFCWVAVCQRQIH